MFKWFKDCQTIEDVKKTYKKLAIKYHPDLNKERDTTAVMAEINNEYEKAFNCYKNIHSSDNAKQAENGATSEYNTAETPEMFRDIINGLIHCDGVNIDIVGSWVWLTGSTYEYRETIKGLGFKWANKKKAWYWHADDYKCRRSNMTLDEIKMKYGCQSVKTKAQLKLP